MKEKFLLLSAFALCLGFVSCSSDDDAIPEIPETCIPTSTSTLLLQPATSSTVTFYANDAEISDISPVSYESITTTELDAEEEKAVIEQFLPEKNGNIDNLTTDFLYYAKDGDVTFDFYFVYGMSTTTHNIGIFYYDENNNLIKVPISQWQGIYTYYPNNGTVSTEYAWSQEKGSYTIDTYTGVRVTVKQGYKFGFYWNGTLKNGYTYEETTYYTSPSLNTETARTDGNGTEIGGTSTIHAGTFYYNGKTYLGLEDWTDFDYQDIVFTCVGEVATTTSGDTTPDGVEETTTPDEGGDEGTTPTDPEEGETTTPEDPVDEEVKQYGGSVEVNLALNAERENDDYIYSHLSLHVRDTTDVTITLPVPAEYVVSSDDMMIVKNHEENNYVLNEQQETFSMVINGNTVTLTITHAESYMTISTSGINADVLKYLRTNYNDGLTFEVRTYFNNVDADGNVIFDRSALQALLNQSTISFDDAETSVYVRANGYVTEDGVVVSNTVDPWACSVIPVEASLNLRTIPTEAVSSANSELWLYPLK